VNYIEIADIDTLTTGVDVATADAQTDGLTVNGVMLPLNQFHFHSPSEHTINGAHYPLEMHMVHKLFTNDGTVTGTPVASTATGAIMAKAAVIGIMFAYSCVCPAQRLHFCPARVLALMPAPRALCIETPPARLWPSSCPLSPSWLMAALWMIRRRSRRTALLRSST
jgi:hypothetical protein